MTKKNNSEIRTEIAEGIKTMAQAFPCETRYADCVASAIRYSS
jgi:hypothetical protein